MKIYTKSGDTGMSSLYNGTRISKNDPIFALLGEIDSVVALIGVASTLIKSPEITADLILTQRKLMAISSEVALADNVRDQVTEADITKLEQLIDKYTVATPELTNFILPGGSTAGAELHFVRTQVRQVERLYLQQTQPPTNEFIGPYLNRLSDYFFALARYINKQEGVGDVKWE